MGEAVLSAFLQVVFDKLASPLLKELGLLWGVKKEFEKLRTTFLIIQDVLEDAEEKQEREKAVKNWLRKLKEVAYEADDLLDEFTTEALRRKVAIHDRVVNKVRNFASLSNPLVFRFKMGHKVKELRDKLDETAEERLKYGLTTNKNLEASQREPTGSFIIESDVYGRDEDKERIVQLLTATSNEENLSVIPIVGIGGLGKTTLAQLAYKDQRVGEHFQQSMWVYVSDKFDLISLIQNILESARGNKVDLVNMDILQLELQKSLTGKRFLLVLDDLWSEDYQKSEDLKKLLSCGDKGSKVIVTTRSERVASIWGTIHSPFCLKGLSDDDCWALFEQRAFGVGRKKNAELVRIGRKMVKKCRGVPLAAKTLGGVMHGKRDENAWLSVNVSETWKIYEVTGIIPALRLSYHYLPRHLKQCFTYCSIILKGYAFRKEELLQFWAAQGFIQSWEVSKTMEDISCEYFNYLMERSFFEVVKKDDKGNPIICRMHDLMTDLARSIAGDECLFVESNSAIDIPTTTRHLSLDVRATSQIPESLFKASNLRTLHLWVNPGNIEEIPIKLFPSLRYLRSLELSVTNIKSLPSSIGMLKHLRYLNIARTKIQVLPKSISSLINLQTLLLWGCTNLKELPKDMWKMISLRHLDINGCDLLTHMPSKIRHLSCLQNLSMFIVSEKSRCSSLGELKNLNLRGELNIKNLKNVRNAIVAKEANLKEKHHLTTLRLSWDDYDEANSIEDTEQVMEGLQPHPNLKRLHIKDYGGVNFPSWMMDSSLRNLIEMSLVNCKKCQKLEPLRQLPFQMNVVRELPFQLLKVVTLQDLPDLEKWWGDDDGAQLVLPCVAKLTIKRCPKMTTLPSCPSLEEVTFEILPNLEKWWGEEGTQLVLPRLTKMSIETCPNMTTLPSCPSLKDLKLHGSNSSALKSVANFESLFVLEIGCFPDLTYLDIGFLPNLHTLKVVDCPCLIHLPTHLENSKNLKVVHIDSCTELMSTPNLKYVEDLHLWYSEALVDSWCSMRKEHCGLTSLKELSIMGCPNMKSFPDGIPHFSSLQSLEIWGFPELESLPESLGNLTSLKVLRICHCPKIMSLPMGLQRLTTIQALWIDGCPDLERRCVQDIGEDWHKIAHIPNIHINSFLSLVSI